MKPHHLTAALTAIVLTTGCGGAKFDEPTVESTLKDKIELQTIDLSPAADGYTGTGTLEGGETMQIDVTVSPGGDRIDYTATGDRGTTQSGMVENTSAIN